MSEMSVTKVNDELSQAVFTKKPLLVTLFFESGNVKAVSPDTVLQSEKDHLAMAQGQTLPSWRDTALTAEETTLAKRTFTENGIHIG
jgi:hypothetical protein